MTAKSAPATSIVPGIFAQFLPDPARGLVQRHALLYQRLPHADPIQVSRGDALSARTWRLRCRRPGP